MFFVKGGEMQKDLLNILLAGIITAGIAYVIRLFVLIICDIQGKKNKEKD
jgi:hypothetical protein